MINTELEQLIKSFFLFSPTKEQNLAIQSFVEFLFSRDHNRAFLLKGFAGTGKTSLVGAFVKTLDELKQKVILLAPTGRAAKVFSLYAGHAAFTIHKKIYRQKSFSNELTNFLPAVNLYQHTLFIVDEASMISNEGLSGTFFGSGRLLDDLIHYVYSGTGCRLMLLGDTAQLPPIGEEDSPALSSDILRGYNLSITEAMLTQVVRQEQESGILWNATLLRHLIFEENTCSMPQLRLAGFVDVCCVQGDELLEKLEECYSKAGADQTIVITRSNNRANMYNNGIRNRILGREEELTRGDRLIVVKNNYFWAEKKEPAQPDIADVASVMEFIANGDVAVVVKFRNEREMHGFRFADVVLRFPDYDDYEVEATVLLDVLQCDAPALTRQQSEALFNAVWEDYPEITVKRERMKKIKQDPYYNALQVKYSYAVTCHKAQGGQWQRVFLDQGFLAPEMFTSQYLHWLYTAVTRATETIYLVNWPEAQIQKEKRNP